MGSEGAVRKYTAVELKELKGPNPDLPGYQGEFGELKAGQLVRGPLGLCLALTVTQVDPLMAPRAADALTVGAVVS